MPAPEQNRDDLMKAILDRAAHDPVFRGGLLTDPRGAIARAFGVSIPPETTIRFVEKPPDVDALVVLPPLAAASELSEEELEIVAGGAQRSYHWAPPPAERGRR